MQENLSHLSVWLLDDGKAGHVNQSLGLLETLGIFNIKRVNVRKKKNAWFWRFINLEKAIEYTSDWQSQPDMVVGAGNTAALTSQLLRKRFPNTFIVQLMRGVRPFRTYDVMAVPGYDSCVPATENVIRTIGALNRIDFKKLAEDKQKFTGKFSNLKGKKLAVLVGGSSKRFHFGQKEALSFYEDVERFAQKHEACLMVTTSRRTGATQTELLKEKWAHSGNFFWDGHGHNPYFAMLEVADAVVTTPDSISMISEGCSTGKPVFIWGLNKPKMLNKFGKFIKFFNILISEGRVFTLTQNWPVKNMPPLADTTLVAGFISARWKEKKSRG